MAIVWWIRGPAAGMLSWCGDAVAEDHEAAGNCQRFDNGGRDFRPPLFGSPLNQLHPEFTIESQPASQIYDTRVMVADQPKRRGRPRKIPVNGTTEAENRKG